MSSLALQSASVGRVISQQKKPQAPAGGLRRRRQRSDLKSTRARKPKCGTAARETICRENALASLTRRFCKQLVRPPPRGMVVHDRHDHYLAGAVRLCD